MRQIAKPNVNTHGRPGKGTEKAGWSGSRVEAVDLRRYHKIRGGRVQRNRKKDQKRLVRVAHKQRK